MRITPPFLLSAAALPFAGLVLGAAAPPARRPPAARASFERDVAPLVGKHCIRCHGPSGAAGIHLTERTFAAVLKNRRVWERAVQNVKSGAMPPQGEPAPSAAERERLVGVMESLLSQADCQIDDPGRVTMRRLNRAEYNHTVRDLLGVELRLADSFPSDDVGYGFDNIGDVLSISPLLMEKYLAAAEKAARAAIVAPETRKEGTSWSGAQLAGGGAEYESAARRFLSVAEAGIDFTFPAAGEYTVTVGAWGQQAGPEPAKLAIRLDGQELRTVAVTARDGQAERYSVPVVVDRPGKRRIAVAFVNDYFNPNHPDPNQRGDRNLIIDSLEVRFPVATGAALPESHRRLIVARPADNSDAAWDAAARRVLAPFVRRAFRRPVTADEVGRLVRVSRLAKARRQSFERGIQLAVQAALVSPHFLFRVERDPRPDDPKARRKLTDVELASRLSYFLWSSLPDETLLRLAEQGKLSQPAVLKAQLQRMLRDPRARALAENFAGQWLQLRKVGVVQPDTERFPTFSEALRLAMRTETETFFTHIVREDRPVTEFLDAPYTFVNETLAKHYGIAGVQGEGFRKIALAGGQRGGLLTQASVLTLTSNPGRTSPVKRGKFVLENLLGTPPPPPPPDVPQLPEEKKGAVAGVQTVRKRLEEHRKNPACANCHQQMDTIGFALENYNGIGAWRTDDGGQPIDASGVLPDGSRFNGPQDLRRLLYDKRGSFVRTLTERLMTYALGRGIEPYDRCNVDEIARRVARENYRFSAIVQAVVESKPFRERRGDEAGATERKVARQ